MTGVCHSVEAKAELRQMLVGPSGLICQFVGKENKYHVDDDDVTCLCRDDDDDCVCLLSFLASSLTRLYSTRV